MKYTKNALVAGALLGKKGKRKGREGKEGVESALTSFPFPTLACL